MWINGHKPMMQKLNTSLILQIIQERGPISRTESLIVAQSPQMRTIPVGISFFFNEVTTAWHLIMTASSCAIVPVLVVFVIFQKHIIKGVQLSGLKG